ncbi:MAG TPA: type II secretion system protein [Dongiaceae bacterium]|nr:type II secretion system protein [Dongiaceae bacterium]
MVAAGNKWNISNYHYNNRPVVSFTPQTEIKYKMKTPRTAHRDGFTLVEIMIVVAIIGLLAAIAIPNFIRARATSQANACINNLRQIDAAVNEWAMENGKASGTTIGSVTTVSSYIKLNSGNSIPQCPASGTYSVGSVGDVPQVSCSLSTATPAHVLP